VVDGYQFVPYIFRETDVVIKLYKILRQFCSSGFAAFQQTVVFYLAGRLRSVSFITPDMRVAAFIWPEGVGSFVGLEGLDWFHGAAASAGDFGAGVVLVVVL
jgi:hypothetical protein